jgi:hypothetical protein
MTSTKEVECPLSIEDFSLEVRRVPSAHAEEPKIAFMLSSVMAHRVDDEVICPYLLRRNLVVPALQGMATPSPFPLR